MVRILQITCLLSVISVSPLLTGGASAGSAISPPQQGGFQTPTPGPDGRIIYIVKEGDSLWTIAALSGLTVEELRALNGIQPNDFISPGMELVLGLAGPAQATEPVLQESTPTPSPATATPVANAGEICVLLFLDQNGNARLNEGEVALAGGQVSVATVSGSVLGEHTTEAEPNVEEPEGHCFTDLPSGDYNVSAAVPEEHNPTTTMNIPVRLDPGDIKFVQFGAQPSAAIGGSVGAPGGDRSVLLGVVGVALLLMAGGLAYYATQYNKRDMKSLR